MKISLGSEICVAQRRRSSGNISTKREGPDEIGLRRRTDPERLQFSSFARFHPCKGI
jgi:hypothetical protein